jgi:sucrose phosphorylase
VLVIRRAAGTDDEVTAVTNVSGQRVDLPGIHGLDLVTGKPVAGLRLEANDFAWVRESAS